MEFEWNAFLNKSWKRVPADEVHYSTRYTERNESLWFFFFFLGYLEIQNTLLVLQVLQFTNCPVKFQQAVKFVDKHNN